MCASARIRCRMLLALLACCSGVVLSAPSDFEGHTIAAVQFEPADQPYPEAEMLSRVAPIKPGVPYRAADVRAAIQNLYSTGRFTDIQVDATPTTEGMNLRFITEKQYFVGRVTVEGAPDPPNPGQLATSAKMQLGEPFTRTDLPQADDNIMERLRANGLFKSKISHQEQRQPDIEQINVDFKIDPGDRAQFGGVVIEGNPERSESSIIRSTKWRHFLIGGWRPLTENRLQSGFTNIRSYYQKNGRLLAKISLSKMDYDEARNIVIPTIRIDAGPIIRVRTQGARLSGGKLRSLVPIFQEQSVDESLLVEGRRNIADYFETKGYFDVTVDYELLPEENGVEVIEYLIDRNGRHKLTALKITGNKYFDEKTLRERMYIQPSSFIRFRHGRYNERYLAKDIAAIEELYRSNGFRDIKITPKVIDNYGGHTGDIAVELDVAEGPQWFVSSLQIDGPSPADAAYLDAVLHSTQGQPYSEYNIATDRDTVLSYYYNNGYPQAQFDWSRSDAGPQQVALRFAIAPGPRRYIRDVIVGGLQRTDPELVRNRITMKPGDPLSQIRIADTQRRLYDLGIFAKVETAIQNPSGNEDRKYVLFEMEEARRYSVNVGFGAELGRIGQGVTTFDAPAGTGGFAPRISFGVSRLNFLGLAHTISLQTRASTLQQRATLSYFAPQFKGRENLNLTVSALWDHSRDVQTFAARRWETSIQLGQKVSRANTIQYRFTYRDIFVDPNSVKITPELIPILSQSVRTGTLGGSFIQDRRDDPIDARRGVYNTVDFGLSLSPFGSQSEFARTVVRNATYHRITREITFARSINFGWIDRLGGLPEIPLPERFFSGGSASQRAFPDNQAGPRDPVTGFPLGGTALLMNSLELRFPFIGDTIGGVLFHDAGNVYSSIENISFRFNQRDLKDFDYMVHGFGFGIRVRTPIGPFRADFSLSPNSPYFYGFKGSRDDLLTCSAPGSTTPCQTAVQRINVFQFHFSLGQAF